MSADAWASCLRCGSRFHQPDTGDEHDLICNTCYQIWNRAGRPSELPPLSERYAAQTLAGKTVPRRAPVTPQGITVPLGKPYVRREEAS